jgi:hypothetical protein
MALHLDPGEGWERLRPRDERPAAGLIEKRIARDGVEMVAHGATICPACSLPVSLQGRTPAGHAIRCPFCDHEARARDFLARDVYDTVANEAFMIARVV